MGLRFEVFGGVRVLGPSGPIPLRPQVARMLGVLLAEPNTPLSVEQILDRLWRDDPPATAAKIVHISIGRLRAGLHTLGDDPVEDTIVRTTAAGYVSSARPDDLDEYLQASERAARLRTSRPLEALAAMTEARAAWRGRPWGDDGEADWLRDRVGALEEGHRSLEEAWGDLMLECDRAGEAVEALRAAAEAEPLRELRWAQLMIALYRGSRQADALRQYERVRRLLRDELGIEPGPELRRLELAILHQDPMLLRTPPRRSDVHAPTSFVGRDDELGALARAVNRDRLVTVTGIGGIGKTRLVTEYAHRETLAGETVRRLGCSGLAATDRFGEHAARELGLFVDEGGTVGPVLAAAIGTAPSLLVIDGAEPVVDEVGHLALTVLDRCPRVRIIITSQIPLMLGVEREFRLAGLSPASLDGPIEGTDLELMLDRAGFDAMTLDAATLDALRSTCGATGGVPLLIELAARRTGWESGIETPDATPIGTATESVRKAIARSLDAADAPARELIALGAVLPGGMSESVATALGGFDGDGARRALRQLAWLHLVDAFPGVTSVRYRSLDPIRTALVDGLSSEDRERATVRSTHALQALVDRIWPDHTAPVVLSVLDAVADEHENLRFLLANRIERSPTDALELAIGASNYWALRGHMVEGRAWLRETMQAARPEGPQRWRAVFALVRATRTMAETAQLREILESACAEATGDDQSQIILGGLLMYLAIARGWQGDRIGAAKALDQAELIDEAIGSEWSHANVDHLRAFDRALAGDFEGARSRQRAFADRMAELDDPASAATGRYLAAALGDMMGTTAVLPAVRDDLAAARELAERVGDVSLLSQILLLEARVLQRANDSSSRAVLVDAAARLVEQGGIRAAALARRDIGLLALRDREHEEAAEHLRFVAPLLLRLDRSASGPAWAGLAVVHLAHGDADGAAIFAAAARSTHHKNAPHWVDDERRVADILDGINVAPLAAPVRDDQLLKLLGDFDPA